MTTVTDTTPFSSSTSAHQNWFTRTVDWLDARGRGAWIATMVAGFLVFGPLGLAILAYMIWSKRMFSSSSNRFSRKMQTGMAMSRPTGNVAFDAYKADTLRRLEEEQGSFESFLERLRASKDKSEFDAFMDERATRKDRETDT